MFSYQLSLYEYLEPALGFYKPGALHLYYAYTVFDSVLGKQESRLQFYVYIVIYRNTGKLLIHILGA